MNFKKITQILLLISSAYMGSAQANSIGFDSSSNLLNLGDSLSIGMVINFDVESLGGSFRLNYDDNILINPVFNFEADLEANYGIETALEDHSVSGIIDFTIGTFSFTNGVLGVGSLGQLSFDTATTGSSSLDLSDVFGGFSDFNTFEAQIIDYQNASVNVSAVPLPAAVWFFISGVGVLISRKSLIR